MIDRIHKKSDYLHDSYFTGIYVFLSSSVLVDLTKPVPGQVVDGSSVNFTDMKYTTSQAKVDLQWRNFYDPESNISHYDVKVYRAGYVLLHYFRDVRFAFEIVNTW